VDPGYRREINVLLINLSNQEQRIERGERIARLVISSYAKSVFEERELLDDSGRNQGGFGSTGA